MGVLTKKFVEHLLVEHPVVPVFHHHLKIHKPERLVKGRPIVAGIGSLLERLGEWVDQYLQHLVTRLPGYIKDTASILKHINEVQWAEHFLWVTLDVKSLFMHTTPSCSRHTTISLVQM